MSRRTRLALNAKSFNFLLDTCLSLILSSFSPPLDVGHLYRTCFPHRGDAAQVVPKRIATAHIRRCVEAYLAWAMEQVPRIRACPSVAEWSNADLDTMAEMVRHRDKLEELCQLVAPEHLPADWSAFLDSLKTYASSEEAKLAKTRTDERRRAEEQRRLAEARAAAEQRRIAATAAAVNVANAVAARTSPLRVAAPLARVTRRAASTRSSVGAEEADNRGEAAEASATQLEDTATQMEVAATPMEGTAAQADAALLQPEEEPEVASQMVID